MKTLKFRPHLCEQILSGEKTSTWRLFDDKDLQPDDEVQFLNKETLEQFGTATLDTVTTKTLGTLEESDREGHDRFSSDEAMYEEFIKYYGDKVGSDSEVKIIHFTFTKI